MPTEWPKTVDLTPHPANDRIYGDVPDADFVASIRQHGVREILIVTDDYTIVSGHRRWQAAMAIGIETLQVDRRSFATEADVLLALLEGNRQRVKTNDQVRAEIEVRREVETTLAAARQLTGKRPPQDLAVNLPQASTPLLTPDTHRAPDVRTIVSNDLGISPKTVDRYARVSEAREELVAAGRTEDVEALRVAVNKSVSAGEAEAIRLVPSVAPVKRSAEEIKLSDYKLLDPAEQQRLLDVAPSGGFNRQDNDSIGWAQWTWNPVTGCLHGCTYCYARDIAERFYTHKFVPVLHPSRIKQPDIMRVPATAEHDFSYRNVFVCSMADVFGKWVPSEWIETILTQVRKHPEWNFLFLTKFPHRLLEFDFPDNAWVGTSVDAQIRVDVVEKAFADVRAKVKWLSCEPLLEPLKFKRLDLFSWVVIGGASRSNRTPEWRPPYVWTQDLIQQAFRAGTQVHCKQNLWGELERVAPLGRVRNVPAEFHMKYLRSNIDEVRELPSLQTA